MPKFEWWKEKLINITANFINLWILNCKLKITFLILTLGRVLFIVAISNDHRVNKTYFCKCSHDHGVHVNFVRGQEIWDSSAQPHDHPRDQGVGGPLLAQLEEPGAVRTRKDCPRNVQVSTRSNLHLILTTLTNRSRWSRGNVLSSRSKVRGFKSDWGRWIFPGRKNPEHKSSGRDFKLGVPSLRFQAR